MMRTRETKRVKKGVPGVDVDGVETPCSVGDCSKVFVAGVDETKLPEGWSFDAEAKIRCEDHAEWTPVRVCATCRRKVPGTSAFDRCQEHPSAELKLACPACQQVMLHTTEADNLICEGCTREVGGFCETHDRAFDGYCPECTLDAAMQDLTEEQLAEGIDWVVETVDLARRGVKRIDAHTWLQMQLLLRKVRAHVANGGA